MSSRVLKIVLALALGGQALAAQPAQPTAPTAPGGPAAPPPSDVDIAVRRRPSLGPQEMIQQSRDYRVRMQQVSQQIDGMVENARKQKDIIRLNCLLDKLAQVKANVSIADSALQSLQETAAKRDENAS